MKPGIYRNPKIVEAALGESPEKKTKYYSIIWDTEEGEIESIHWMPEGQEDGQKKAKERSIKTLLQIGFLHNDISQLVNPKLKINDLFGQPVDDVSLDVEEEEYTNSKGEVKTKCVVKWVNVGNQTGLKKFDHAQAVAVFKSSTLNGDLQKFRLDIPAPKKPVAQSVPEVKSDDIPF